MLRHGFTVRTRALSFGCSLLGALTAACSFYADCPCANQPPGGNAGAVGGGAGSGGAGGTGGTGGTSGSGSGGDAGTDGGAGDTGTGGTGGTGATGSWSRATGNLAERSAACGNVTFLSVKPDENLLIAAVIQDGLWGSRDGGASWEPLGVGTTSTLINNIVQDLQYDPDDSDTFWEVGIYGPGVFKTSDGGENFSGLGSIQHNDYLSIDFADPDRQLMLAGGHEQGKMLYRSLDGGENWEEIGSAIPETCRWSSYPILFDADTYLLGCWNGILRTTDGGESWEPVSSFGGASVPLVTTSGSIYWTIENSSGLVRSDDDGLTWERVVGGGVLSAARPIELPDGSIATTTGTRIVRSSDQGRSWQPVTPELPFTPSGVVYSPHEGAFFAWQSTCETQIPKDAVMRFDITEF
jgi:photosystem II stability/assembly factor-like uncharacterized protein